MIYQATSKSYFSRFRIVENFEIIFRKKYISQIRLAQKYEKINKTTDCYIARGAYLSISITLSIVSRNVCTDAQLSSSDFVVNIFRFLTQPYNILNSGMNEKFCQHKTACSDLVSYGFSENWRLQKKGIGSYMI